MTTQDPREEVQELANALTGDLATHLNLLRYLTSRATQTPDETEYRLSANLRTSGKRLRLEARLDAPDGTQVLSDKIDGNLDDIFGWQDETGLKLAQRVLDGLIPYEVALFDDLDNMDCTAEQLLLRMMTIFDPSGESVGSMVDLMNLAIEKKPGWGASYAYAIAGWALAVSNGLGRYVSHHRDKTAHWTAKVEELEPAFSHARILAAIGKIVLHGDRTGAVNDVYLVLRNMPFDPEELTWAAWIFNYCDLPGDAFDCIEQVERSIVPKHLISTLINARALAHMLAEEYETAAGHAMRASDMSPTFIGAYLIASTSYALDGNSGAAARAMEKVLSLSPGYSLHKAGWREGFPYPPGIIRYFEGLRMAGLPD